MAFRKSEVLAELEALGTASGAATYRRHGATGTVWGVRYADLGKLKKKIKVDQALADELWSSGVHDAQVLATMIADPEAMRGAHLDRWTKGVSSYFMACALADIAAKSADGPARVEEWRTSKKEWIASLAWDTLARLAGDPGAISDERLAAYIDTIQNEIHESPNRVRYSMNGALIAIGSSRDALEKKALAAARRIGKVDVDHGDTSCKTPDAAPYIEKAAAHRRKKLAKKKAKKK